MACMTFWFAESLHDPKAHGLQITPQLWRYGLQIMEPNVGPKILGLLYDEDTNTFHRNSHMPMASKGHGSNCLTVCCVCMCLCLLVRVCEAVSVSVVLSVCLCVRVMPCEPFSAATVLARPATPLPLPWRMSNRPDSRRRILTSLSACAARCSSACMRWLL